MPVKNEKQVRAMTSGLVRSYEANMKKVALTAEDAVLGLKTPIFAQLGALSLGDCHTILDLIGGMKSPEENFTLLLGLTDYFANECTSFGFVTPSEGSLFYDQDAGGFTGKLASVWRSFLPLARSDLMAESFNSLVLSLADSLCTLIEYGVDVQEFEGAIDQAKGLLPSSKHYLISKVSIPKPDHSVQATRRKRRPSLKSYQAPILHQLKYKDLRASDVGRSKGPGGYSHLRRNGQPGTRKQGSNATLRAGDDSGSEWEPDSFDRSPSSSFSCGSSSPVFTTSSCDDAWFSCGQDSDSTDSCASSQGDAWSSVPKSLLASVSPGWGDVGQIRERFLATRGCLGGGDAGPRVAANVRPVGGMRLGMPPTPSVDNAQPSPALPRPAPKTSGRRGTVSQQPFSDGGSAHWPGSHLKRTEAAGSSVPEKRSTETSSPLTWPGGRGKPWRAHQQNQFSTITASPSKVTIVSMAPDNKATQSRPVPLLQDVTNVHPSTCAYPLMYHYVTAHDQGVNPVRLAKIPTPATSVSVNYSPASVATKKSALLHPRTPDGNRNAFKMMMDNSKNSPMMFNSKKLRRSYKMKM